MPRSTRATRVLAAAGTLFYSHVAHSDTLLAWTKEIPTTGAPFSGVFTGKFTTTAPNTRVLILFNAECAVSGGPLQWLKLDILVKPAGQVEALVPPTTNDNAFCSGNSTPDVDGWMSAATIAPVLLKQAGEHVVSVRG